MVSVPVLKSQQVAAQPLAGGYADASVSALSQGGGLAEGLSSLGGAFAAEAKKAKTQALQASYNNSTANDQAKADAAWGSLAAKDGPAYMQSIEPTRTALKDQFAATRAELDPELQSDYDAWSARALGEFDARSIGRGNDVRINMGQQALANKIQTNTASAARDAGSIRYSQYAADANKSAPTGTKAPEIVGAGIVDSRLSEITKAIDDYADANQDHLPTDKATWSRLAKEKATSDFHASVLEGMLTPTPGKVVDDRAALGYFKSHEAAMEQDDRTRWQDNIDRANVAGSAQREAAGIWGDIAALPSWSERDAEADKQIAAIKDPEVRKATQALYDHSKSQAQEGERLILKETHDTLLSEGLAGQLSMTALVQDPRFGTLLRDNPDAAQTLLTKFEQLPEGGIVTDIAVFGEAMEQLTNPETQREAAKMNPNELPVSPEHAKKLQAKIDDIAKNGVGPRSVDQVISQSIASVVNESTVRDASERAKLNGDMWEAASNIAAEMQAQTKKPVTAEQMQGIMDNLLATAVRSKSWFGSGKSPFEQLAQAAGGPIPNVMLADLSYRIRQRGETVTEEAIRDEYADLLSEFRTAEINASFDESFGGR